MHSLLEILKFNGGFGGGGFEQEGKSNVGKHESYRTAFYGYKERDRHRWMNIL